MTDHDRSPADCSRSQQITADHSTSQHIPAHPSKSQWIPAGCSQFIIFVSQFRPSYFTLTRCFAQFCSSAMLLASARTLAAMCCPIVQLSYAADKRQKPGCDVLSHCAEWSCCNSGSDMSPYCAELSCCNTGFDVSLYCAGWSCG